MKKVYLSALRKYFEARLAEFAPNYEPLKLDRSHLLFGALVYVKKLSRTNWTYICLRPSFKGHDEFDFEIGWSRCGRIPENIERSAELFSFVTPVEIEKRLYLNPWPTTAAWEFERPPSVNPLPHQRSGAQLTPDLARRVVEPIAEEAIKHLIAVALPILWQVERYVAAELEDHDELHESGPHESEPDRSR